MCFSASASFTAGALLTTVGVLCIKKKQNRQQLMFATIPFIFALQQFSEGFVWRLLDDPTGVNMAIRMFLFFALVVWPSWVPISMLMLEKNRKRQHVLIFISTIGLAFSVAGLYYLFTRTPGIEILNLHIHCDLKLPHHLVVTLGMVYMIPTILPFFISTVQKAVFIGWLVLFSHIVSLMFFNDTTLSVWCFFAALISTLIYVIVWETETETEQVPLTHHSHRQRRTNKRQLSNH